MMTEIVMCGSRANLAGLLRLMADEVEGGGVSATAFSDDPGRDPSITIRVVASEDRQGPGSTTVKVIR